MSTSLKKKKHLLEKANALSFLILTGKLPVRLIKYDLRVSPSYCVSKTAVVAEFSAVRKYFCKCFEW